MIKLYWGTDQFRIQQKLNEEMLGLQMNVNIVAHNHLSSWSELYTSFNTQDLLTTNSRVVIVKDIFSLGNSQIKEKMLDWLKEYSSKNEPKIIFIESDIKTADTKKISKACANIVIEEFKEMNVRDVSIWINKVSTEKNYNVSIGVGNFLAQNFGNDLWRINNELEKAHNFTNGDLITKEIIQKLISPTLDDTIFQFIDALGARNLPKANKLLNRQLHMGTTEPEIVNMISYQFRNILNLKALDDKNISKNKWASITKLHPYVIQKTTSLTQRFSMSQLKKIFSFTHKTDMAYKTGKAPSKNSLDILVAQIVSC